MFRKTMIAMGAAALILPAAVQAQSDAEEVVVTGAQTTRAVTVSLADLNLSYDQAVSVADRRLQRAARQACDYQSGSLLNGLAMCLIAHEVNTHKGSWRHIDRRTVAYLRFIEDQGYALSPVERRACGDHVDTDEL